MHIDFPYHLDGRGRTAQTGDGDHVRDLIEQVLFTMPGERVNRPGFGSGLMQYVFAPNSDLLAGAMEATVQAALQEHLGEYASIEKVAVESDDGILSVTVQYVIRLTRQRSVSTFSRTT
ncbi:MAG: GPW/gp25 family protein [Planctomycetes bacterium]|nr:GPW/gp25 family protein [Planctomycetota bacterium]